MNAEKQKLQDIKEVYELWSGGFIRGNSAMHDIGQLLRTNYMKLENLTVSDTNGNTLEVFKETVFKINTK